MSGFRRRLRYRFDNILSRGTWAVLLSLAIATLVVIGASSLILTLFNVTLSGSAGGSWLEDLWQSTLRTLDSGTMANDVGWGRRILALLVTLFGILIAGTLIGIIATGVEQRIETMQRGRSGVVETGHVVILGASPQLPDLVEQLALAGRQRRNSVIVVLADRPPAELSHEVRSFTPDLFGTRLVFRWGDRTNVGDLAIVALDDARAVIVLSDDAGDADVVRTVLAVDVARSDTCTAPIVAEVNDPTVGQGLVAACGEKVHPITSDQAIARLAAYAFRGPQVMRVLRQLLDFHRAGIYVRDPGDLTGRTFADGVLAFEAARVIGVIDAEGDVAFAPPPGTVLTAHHRLVVVAHHDAPPLPTRAANGSPPVPVSPALSLAIDEPHPQHVLIVGWNRLAGELLEQLDQVAAAGSTVTIIYDTRHVDAQPDRSRWQNIDVTLTTAAANPVIELDDAAPGALTAVLLAAYRHDLTAADADSRTLLNLRAIRHQLTARGSTPAVLIELRDAANVDLAAPIGPDDFVISDAIGSALLAQLAEQPERRAALLRLYGDQRPGIGSIDPATIGISGDVQFQEIARRTYEAGVIAIGISAAPARGGDLTLCPDATSMTRLGEGDRIVVIG